MRKLITTDNHLTPPPWLIDELPERLRPHVANQMFLVEDRPDGRYLVIPMVRDSMMNTGMPSEIKIDDERLLSKIVHSSATLLEENNPAFDPEGRLEDMDREGVVAAVLIGTPEFGANRGPLVREAQVAWCQVVNDWLADTYQDHLGRFAPGIHLPYLDPAACATELERAAAMGLRPAVLPDGIFDSPYYLPDWEPVWEAAAGLGVPITMHIAAQRTEEYANANPMAPKWPGESIEGFYTLSVDMGATLTWLTLSGVFERHPDLTVVMTEGYAFWLAGVMQFLDHHFEGRFGNVARAAHPLPELPSHYLKRQARATFMWDPLAIRNRELTGIDCLMWGNDYPHPEGAFPYSQEWVEKQFAGVPEDEIERMTFGNAKELFGFDV
ncbi:MAG TPA: amidohydrolase family protein [Acidimicrobiia bacterium]|nr:amidohydrolase family protein [Acidimicrobiia bacterium]